MDRKAALELGVNTVVILVIAMVVIAAGIAFIRTFFDQGTKKLLEPFELTEFGLEPTLNDPLVVQSLIIKSGKEQDLKVGFYNSLNTPVNAKMAIGQCASTLSSELVIPRILSVPEEVPALDKEGFIVVVTAKSESGTNLLPGKYVCPFRAVDGGGTVLASKQVILEVTQ